MTPAAMVCPECGEAVRQRRPATLVPGLRAEWSHLDGEPLCPVMGPDGYEPAQPVEAWSGPRIGDVVWIKAAGVVVELSERNGVPGASVALDIGATVWRRLDDITSETLPAEGRSPSQQPE